MASIDANTEKRVKRQHEMAYIGQDLMPSDKQVAADLKFAFNKGWIVT